jgi:hypothetical protein
LSLVIISLLLSLFSLEETFSNSEENQSTAVTDICELYGSVYIEEERRFAHYLVYENDSEAFADLVVYEEDSRLFADGPGLWYAVNNRQMADFSIYFVDRESGADFSVYYTDVEAFAKCNK